MIVIEEDKIEMNKNLEVGTLSPMQQEALSTMENLDFPTRKTEDWKYTRVNKIINREYSTLTANEKIEISDYRIDGIENVVVLVNGEFQEELSEIETTQEGVIISSLKEAATQHTEIFNAHFGKQAQYQTTIFTAMNTAHCKDGAFIYAAKNVQVKTPIQVIHICSGENTISQAHHLYLADSSSQLNIIETYVSNEEASAFNNVVAEFYVSENAELSYDKIQIEGNAQSSIVTEEVYQEKNSRFNINTITLKGGFIRNNLNIIVDGENCETNLNGLYLPTGKQHIDNHTVVDHQKPNCESNELYKGIISDTATGVFNGKVFVRPDAQKINAYQNNGNILLSDNATMNSKPELEIYADDVKCSHGSTTGQLDPEALFYLQARGIGKTNAKLILTNAFVTDVLEGLKLTGVREMVENWRENYPQ